MRGRQFLVDLALLLARLGLGLVLVAHGWHKAVDRGLDGTAADLARGGVPAPTLVAYYSVVVELLGGIALALGLTVPLAGILVAIDMAITFAFLHFTTGNALGSGSELVLILGTQALLVAACGSGRLGLDHLFTLGRRRR